MNIGFHHLTRPLIVVCFALCMGFAARRCSYLPVRAPVGPCEPCICQPSPVDPARLLALQVAATTLQAGATELAAEVSAATK